MTHQVYEQKLRIRFSHCDPAGIVYHPQYYLILNQLMEDFLLDVLGLGFIEIEKYHMGCPVVGIRPDFTAPGKVGDECVARIWIDHLGKSSMRFAFTIHCGDELRLQCVETSVCVRRGPDGQHFQKLAIPEEIRAKLLPYTAAPDEVLQLRA